MLLPQLVELAPVVARALAPGGTAVASGVLDDQRDQVAAACLRGGPGAAGVRRRGRLAGPHAAGGVNGVAATTASTGMAPCTCGNRSPG